jgi:hypothetical protein
MADRLAALGGSIDLRSTLGAGTTVSGRVPVRAELPAATPEPPGTSTPFTGTAVPG